jgi:hypothetical protein
MASYRQLDADARRRVVIYTVIAVALTFGMAVATSSPWVYLGGGLAYGVVASVIELRRAFTRQRL